MTTVTGRPSSSTRQEFLAAISTDLEVPVDGPDSTELAGLGWDSLTLMEVVAWADDRGVDLEPELVASVRTIGDLWSWVGQRVVDARGDTDASLPGARPRPSLHGPTVELRPVGPRHEDLLASWLLAPENLVGYRLRGGTLSPERARHLMWDGVLTQFIVQTRGGMAAGWVAAIQPDFRNRHVHLTAVCDPDHRSTGAVPEGTLLLVRHLFDQYDLRKVYAEVLESNLAAFRSGVDRLFRIEGRLTEHEFIDGRYEDLLLLATDRALVHRSDPR